MCTIELKTNTAKPDSAEPNQAIDPNTSTPAAPKLAIAKITANKTASTKTTERKLLRQNLCVTENAKPDIADEMDLLNLFKTNLSGNEGEGDFHIDAPVMTTVSEQMIPILVGTIKDRTAESAVEAFDLQMELDSAL